jgi:acetate kinase
MGFTPLEGPAMATRSGSVDPGLLLHVMKTAPMTVDEMSDALYHHSGLAGMSGTNGDLRHVLAAASAGDHDAELAYDVYLHRLRREIGAAAMSLDRLDAVVFTGGVAEHQPEVVDAVLDGLTVLGMRAGTASLSTGDRVISPEGARVAALIVIVARRPGTRSRGGRSVGRLPYPPLEEPQVPVRTGEGMRSCPCWASSAMSPRWRSQQDPDRPEKEEC